MSDQQAVRLTGSHGQAVTVTFELNESGPSVVKFTEPSGDTCEIPLRENCCRRFLHGCPNCTIRCDVRSEDGTAARFRVLICPIKAKKLIDKARETQ